jgi:hypothetical protein
MKQMRWCIDHPKAVAEMGTTAAEAAQAYSWEVYHQRVREVLREVVNQEQQAQQRNEKRGDNTSLSTSV